MKPADSPPSTRSPGAPFRRRTIRLSILLLSLLARGGLPARPADASGTPYQVVLDVEDPCFETLGGDWYLPSPRTGSYLGSFYLEIDGPGSGAGRGRWIAEGLPNGEYLVEFYADDGDYPSDARYRVVAAGGVRDLIVDMHRIGSGWHPLATTSVERTCVVTVSDEWYDESASRLRVDALRFTLLTALPDPPQTIRPRIGICIDDVGGVDPSLPSTPIYRMLRLPFAMTFAVLPERPYSAASAEEIHAMGSEVFLHQPMGYISNPNPAGSEWIRSDMTPAESRAVFARNLDSIPHVAGANNHTGSLVTQQLDKMRVCMEELRERGLFWLDSRTFTESVAYDVAQETGLLTAERDLFLDGYGVEEARARILDLALRARFAPTVPHVGIGHVRDSTAQALEEIVPELEALGVDVVPVSRWMTQVIEPDRLPAGAAFSATGPWTADPEDRPSKELADGDAWIVSSSPATRLDTAVFLPALPIPGTYEIFTTWQPGANDAPCMTVTIDRRTGRARRYLDPSAPFADWHFLGRYSLGPDSGLRIVLGNDSCGETDTGVLRADAVKLVYVGPRRPRPDLLELR